MLGFLKERRRRRKRVSPATRLSRNVGVAAGAAAGGLIAALLKSVFKK